VIINQIAETFTLGDKYTLTVQWFVNATYLLSCREKRVD